MCTDGRPFVKGGSAGEQFAALMSPRHDNGLYSTVHESGRVASTPAEGLDDHLGHHLVPEGRGVVGDAGDTLLTPVVRSMAGTGVIRPGQVDTLYLRCVTPGASTARTCSSCSATVC
jgi:hypothetical protein